MRALLQSQIFLSQYGKSKEDTFPISYDSFRVVAGSYYVTGTHENPREAIRHKSQLTKALSRGPY